MKVEWETMPAGESIVSFSGRVGKRLKRNENSVRAKINYLLRTREIERAEIEAELPAVLFVDIETLQFVRGAWSAWDDNASADTIIRDWAVLSWSAKWLGDDRLMSDVLTPKEIPWDLRKPVKDKRICGTLWQLFDQADVVVAQNGIKFDIPKMNTRWWFHGMGKPSSCKVIDTLQTARKIFSMTFNSLDYLAHYLGLGGKLKTELKLWNECRDGNKEALQRMKTYNENDVLLLELVYEKMRGWIPNHPRYTIYSEIKDVCPVCLDANIKYIGLYYAAVRRYREFRCGKCHSIWHSTRHIK